MARTPAGRRARYGKIERALLAFVRGESLTLLRAVENELFPLPEEVSSEAAAA